MSTYIFHVLYQHSTPHAVTTLVVLLSTSVCIFLWFNRKSKQSPAILATDPHVVPELPPTNLSKETALEVQPPTPSTPAPSSSLKKNKPTKGDKKGDKSKKRQGKQQQPDAPPAPKVRTLAHRRPARRPDDSAASITEDHQEEHHAPQSPSIEASEVKPPEDGTSTGSQNSPPRAASPSPSEATTATTAATIQSSTLILTPPPTVLPSLVSLPVEHEKDARVPPSPPHSNDDATVRLDDAGDEESNATATTQIEHDGWIRMDNETPTVERREPPPPLLVPPPTIPIDITTPTSPQNEPESLKPSPTASTSNIPPPDDGETVVPSPTPSHPQPPAIITPATPDKSETPAIPRPSPSSQPRSLTPSEYPRSPRTRQGSSGGVGLGIPGTTPASGSQSRVGVSRSSPASSPLRTGQIPLPPRHRRHQPGQPPQQQQQQIPPPLLQPLPPYAHYGGRPGTPGSGLRSPTSPGVPFVGASGWIPGPGYSPAAQQPHPQAFLRPYPPPGYMHPPGPPGPHGAAAPPAGLMPYFYHPGNVNNSHGRSRSASDISPYQGVPGMTSITPGVPPASQARTAGPKSRSQDVKGKNKDTSGKEGDEEEDDFVVEFPTLNPTPGKPSQSSESENAGEGVSSAVNGTQSTEPQPTGWMSPGYAPYPPEMLSYPPPWSPQAAAYFQPRPYPHPSQIPGVSTPSTSSTSSSPAWTHLGLPPPNALPRPNAVATQPEGGANDQQQQQPYASGPADEDLRRQTLANSIASKPGTSTPSASGSATSSPRVGFNHLHLMAGPSATPPFMQPLSPLTPTSGHVPLMPNPHLMRQGLTPSPGPMAASWHGNAGYFMPGPVPPPHPHWVAAQNGPRSGTPSGEPASFLASPGSRSSSPFVGGRATPPVQAMYPGYFSPPPPHPNYPYGPAPPPPMQHPLMMQGMPPTPGPSYVNGRRSSANSSPLQSRSRKNTASESSASAGGAEEDGEDSDHDSLAGVPDALVEAIFKDPEGFKAASVSSGRSSRGGSRAASIRSASEIGGGGSEKGSACGSPTIEEEPPSAQTA
ncbi:hypothetical protein FRC04_002425 [Tulasnella sp. 424]|nr:hypothetical protein FRC04_002425 [Tulasnella sp. 424]KAG8972844.1 hypothetical protein FRC05_009483 [Tulasnella sp. 425]